MRYQITGVIEYFKMVKENFNSRLISRINLRLNDFIFLQRNHEIFIFAWDRAQSSHDTVVYLFFFNSQSNLSFSTIFGGIKQILNNQVFHASLMKDGFLFRKKKSYIYEFDL